MAGSQRDLVVARTNLQIQEIALKHLLIKCIDGELESAQIVNTDPLPEPRDSDIPTLQETLADAERNRPDLKTAQMNLQNEQISSQYTANNLLPTGNVFGQYASAGLQGNCIVTARATCNTTGLPLRTVVPSGTASSLNQMIDAKFPEESVGFAFTLPINDRAAPRDTLPAPLDLQQSQIHPQA